MGGIKAAISRFWSKLSSAHCHAMRKDWCFTSGSKVVVVRIKGNAFHSAWPSKTGKFISTRYPDHATDTLLERSTTDLGSNEMFDRLSRYSRKLFFFENTLCMIVRALFYESMISCRRWHFTTSFRTSTSRKNLIFNTAYRLRSEICQLITVSTTFDSSIMRVIYFYRSNLITLQQEERSYVYREGFFSLWNWWFVFN